MIFSPYLTSRQAAVEDKYTVHNGKKVSEDEEAVETNGFSRKLVFGWSILHSSVKAMSVSCGIFFMKKFKCDNIVFCIARGRLYNTKDNVICIKGNKFNQKNYNVTPIKVISLLFRIYWLFYLRISKKVAKNVFSKVQKHNSIFIALLININIFNIKHQNWSRLTMERPIYQYIYICISWIRRFELKMHNLWYHYCQFIPKFLFLSYPIPSCKVTWFFLRHMMEFVL